MADVTEPAGIAKQILLVAGLRWRLLHNNLRRKHNRLDLLGLLIIGLLAGALPATSAMRLRITDALRRN